MKFRHKHKINPLALFYLKVSLVISLVIVAVSLGIYLRNNRLLIESVKQQAASYFDLIVRIRRWNSDYGGVYAEKKPGVESNKYLREVGIKPDKTAVDGTVMTLKNPALMTKELSSVTSQFNGIKFHITSLMLLNQENAPDEFELRALGSFTRGEREYWEIEHTDSGSVFRYMAPLPFEQSCQRCHFKFNYKTGDIRGGISVSIPFSTTEKEMALNRLAIIGLSLLTLVLLLGSTYTMLSKLGDRIETVQNALLEASIRDELTGLYNRRFLMSRLHEEFERARRQESSLGLLMMDLDNFKDVNDEYGHPVGDEVLKSVAHTLSGTLREYDIAGRYGGEEFVVVSVEAGIDDLVKLAERIRARIESVVHCKAPAIRITISIGVASLDGKDTPEILLKRADDAMYRAKQEGRNRTVWL
jgi:diguanylate cyclase (GGDEF)-like protein